MNESDTSRQEVAHLAALEKKSFGPRLIGYLGLSGPGFLPIAYIGWLMMNNKHSFLGKDTPTGGRRVFANAAMGLCLIVVAFALGYTTWVKLSGVLSAHFIPAGQSAFSPLSTDNQHDTFRTYWTW